MGNRICAKCGQEIPKDLPGGCCPSCTPSQAPTLLEFGFSWNEYPQARVRLPSGVPSFNDYEILAEIAQGGMGVVYKARQLRLNRIVALKTIRAGEFANQEEIRRFYTEAQAAAHLQHPNIVSIHEVGENQGYHFFSMEYVEGQSLSQRIHDGPLTPRRAADYVRTIASTIHYAHECGILHRDLKPSNILIDQHDQPHVTDFGLAKLCKGDSDRTLSGTVLGSPGYMPPEQAQGRTREISARSDIFSLGAILYELLCGEPPFRAPTPYEMLKQVIESDPVPPRQKNPKIPRDLETICLKCLEKRPAKRYSTAREMADELGRFLNYETIMARPIGSVEKLWRWSLRKPAIAALLLMATLALAGVLFLSDRAQAHAYNQSLAEARVLQQSGLAGQRFQSLAALEKAAALRASIWFGKPPAIDLRSAVIASLTLPDIRLEPGVEENPTLTAALALSPDFKLQARSDLHGNISVRAKDQEVGRLSGNGTPAELLLFSGDARYLAVRYRGLPYFSIWDWNQQELLLTVQGTAIDFSPGNELIAVGDANGQVQLMELPSGNPLREPITIAEERSCDFLKFDPSGRRIAVSGHSLYLFVVNIRSGEIQRLYPHGERLGALAWHPGGDLLAVACRDNLIHLWDLKHALKRELRGHTAAPLQLAFAHHGACLASYGEDQALRLWEISSGRSQVQMNLEKISAPFLQFSPDDHFLGYVLNDSKMSLLNVNWGDECQALHDRHSPLQITGRFAIDAQGELLAVPTSDGIRLWDLPSGLELDPLPLGQMYAVAFRNDTKELLTQGFYGLHRFPASTAIFRGQTLVFGPPRIYEFPPGPENSLQSAGGGAFFALHPDRIVHFDEKGKVVRELETSDRGLRRLAISPDQKWIAAANWEKGEVLVWNGDGLEETNLVVSGRAHLAISPDSKWLATGTETECRLWRTGSWNHEQLVLRRQTGSRPLPLAISPLGDLLAWSGPEGQIDLIHFDTLAPVATLKVAPGSPAVWIDFTPDGSRLVLAREQQPIRIWDLAAIRANLVNLKLEWAGAPLPVRQRPSPEKKGPGVLIEFRAVQNSQRFLSDLRRLELETASNPEDFAKWNERARIHHGLYLLEEAIEYFTRALELQPDRECLKLRAYTYLELNRVEEAMADFQRFAALYPEDPYPYFQLAEILLNGPEDERDVPAGLEYARKAFEIAPRDEEVLFRMGMGEYRAGNFLPSLAYLDQAISMAQQNLKPNRLLFKSLSLGRLGRKPEAEQLFEDALQRLHKSDYIFQRFHYDPLIAEVMAVLEGSK
jgi:eukaryotic-like serine/threonine-protein kinase